MTYYDDLDRISQITGCTAGQVQEVVSLALEILHRTARCDEDTFVAALVACNQLFGEKASAHLGGLLDEHRIWGDDDIPIGEILLRSLGPADDDVDAAYGQLMRCWVSQRSPERRQMDSERWVTD